MMEFAAGISCRMFTYDLAKILHDASYWADLAGVTIQVDAIRESDQQTRGDSSAWLCIEIHTIAERPHDRFGLARYLHVTLPPSYRVNLHEQKVRIEWYGPLYRPN